MHSRAKLMVKSALEKQGSECSDINHNVGEDFASLAASIEFNANIDREITPLINSGQALDIPITDTEVSRLIECSEYFNTYEPASTTASPSINLEPDNIISSNVATELTTTINDEPVPSTSGIAHNILAEDSDQSDFSSGSSENYIPNTDSSTSDENTSKRKKRKSNLIISDSEEDQNENRFWEKEGVLCGKKKKPRTSTKERRIDREKRKKCRNTGQTYETNKGKIIESRVQKPLNVCRMKCINRISQEFRQKIFDYYWGLGTYDKRVEFMKSSIVIEPKKTEKLNPKSTRIRNYTFLYRLKIGGESHNSCKGCFMKTLDETNKFIEITCDKLVRSRLNREPKPSRGKQSSYKSISDSRLEEVKEHILSFPAYESHYSRAQTSKKYLSPDLNIKKMYKLYCEKNDNPVSETIYSWVFKAQNLSFKKPSLDTCLKCDTLVSQIRVTEGDEKAMNEQRLKEHHDRAQRIYDLKNHDKNLSLQNKDTLVICFDLQQCLPTPFLTTGSVFYKRQLWTYNLTLRDCTNKKVYCFMWHEALAGRGANQIASCIYYYIKHFLPENIKHLIFYSDSCSGQNKNSIVIATLLVAVHNTHVESIIHNFFVPGHTHMDCDVDHALIEKAKKRTQMLIHHPRDWFQLVRSCSQKNPFTVIEMSQDDFYDMASLLKGPLQLKKIDDKKKKFMITECEAFKLIKSDFPRVYFKRTDQEDFDFVDFGRKKTKSSNSHSFTDIPKLYSGPIAISAEKKKICFHCCHS